MFYNGDLCVAASIVSYCPRKNWKVTGPQHLVLKATCFSYGDDMQHFILFLPAKRTPAPVHRFSRPLPLSFVYSLSSVCHNPFKVVGFVSLEASIALWGETEESKHISRLLPRYDGQSPSLSSIHSNDIYLTQHLNNERIIRLWGKHGHIYLILQLSFETRD